MATLPKVLISRADYQIGGGVLHLVSELKIPSSYLRHFETLYGLPTGSFMVLGLALWGDPLSSINQVTYIYTRSIGPVASRLS
jgi:hypothetical protein